MTEIQILDVPEETSVETKSEKTIHYEKLTHDMPDIAPHLWNLYDMEMSKETRVVTTLPSIMLKYVMKYCVCIIPDKLYSGYSLVVQDERDVIVSSNDKLICIPANTQITVCGIKIPSVFIKQYSKHTLHHYDAVSDVDIKLSGHYGIADAKNGRFTGVRDSFTHAPGYSMSEVMFKNAAQCLEELQHILTYIDYIEKYYAVNYPLIMLDAADVERHNETPLKWKIINGKLSDGNVAKFDINSEMLNIVNEVHDGTVDNSFMLNLLLALESSRLEKLYNLANSLGVNDTSVKKLLKKAIDAKKKKHTYDVNEVSSYSKQLLVVKRVSIAWDKFKVKKLSDLTDKQKAIVELELKKMETDTKANTTFVTKYRDMITARYGDVLHTLKSTIKAVEEAHPTIKTSTDLIAGCCVHEYAIAKLYVANWNSSSLSVLQRELCVNSWALPEDPAGYFCKVCGEKLADADTEGVMRIYGERTSNPDDPLATMIWKEAMHIIANNVRFITPVPIKPLVSSLSSGLRSVIAHEESKLYRSKTNTADSIADVLNLYACIYIYASLCALMMANPNKLIFAREAPSDYKKTKPKSDVIEIDDTITSDSKDSDVIDYEEAPVKSLIKSRRGGSIRYRGGAVYNDSKSAEKNYLTIALKLILISKETTISRLKTMSIDLIKQIFVKSAYTWATQHARPITVEEERAAAITDDYIINDPFYTYTVYAKLLQKRPHTTVDQVLEKSYDVAYSELKSDGTDAFSAVTMGKPWSFGDDDYDSYTVRGYAAFLEYYKTGLYKKPVTPRHIQHTQFLEKYADLMISDEVQRNLRIQRSLRPSIKINLINDLSKYVDFSPNKIDIAKHFCASGVPHSINKYRYKYRDTIREYTKKETVAIVQANGKELKEFNEMVIIDECCGLCGVWIRSASSGKTSDVNFTSMFSALDDVIAFYQYYETRCPIGNLHVYVDNKCSACDFETKFVSSRDVSYYKKYTGAFKKMQQSRVSVQIANLKEVQKKLVVEKQQEPPAYTQSLKSVAQWATLSGVKYNLLVNIGLFEGHKYTLIESASINPSKTVTPSLTRALRCKTLMNSILQQYTLVIRYDKIIDMPPQLKNIISIDNPSASITQLPKFDDFISQSTLHSTLPVEEYCNFLLEYIASFHVSLYESKSVLGPVLGAYFTTQLLATERYISKPEPYFAKFDNSTLENNSEDEVGVSGDEWANRQSSDDAQSDAEDVPDDIDNDGYDVENADDIWEND